MIYTTILYNRSYVYIHIYIYGPVSPVSTPHGMSPQVAPPFPGPASLVFARPLQHFWLPASHLLGTCYLLDDLRSTDTPSKYLRATYSHMYMCYVMYLLSIYYIYIYIYVFYVDWYYICIHIDTHDTYMYLNKYIYICKHIDTHDTYMFLNMYIYIYIYTHTYVYIYIYTFIHIYICINEYIYIYIRIYIYIFIYTYIYIHV